VRDNQERGTLMKPAPVVTSNDPAPPDAGKAHTSLRPLVRMVFGLEGSEQDRDGVRTLLQSPHAPGVQHQRSDYCGSVREHAARPARQSTAVVR